MTNELKCPVCGERLDRHEEYLGHIDNNPKECCIEGYWTELQLEQIQAAKDKAVIAERERIIKLVEQRRDDFSNQGIFLDILYELDYLVKYLQEPHNDN